MLRFAALKNLRKHRCLNSSRSFSRDKKSILYHWIPGANSVHSRGPFRPGTKLFSPFWSYADFMELIKMADTIGRKYGTINRNLEESFSNWVTSSYEETSAIFVTEGKIEEFQLIYLHKQQARRDRISVKAVSRDKFFDFFFNNKNDFLRTIHLSLHNL